MTIQHEDGTTCMANFWEQSAKLLQRRIDEDDRLLALWDSLETQKPSPEFKKRIESLIAGLKKK